MAKSSDNIVPFRRSPPGGSRPAGWRPPAWLTNILLHTVSGWLILANVAVWVAMVAWSLGAGIVTPFPDDKLIRAGLLVPSLVARQPWRLVTAAFLHANLLHITMNMLFLGWVGPKLEKAYGRGRFLLVYAAALFGGALTSWGVHSIPAFASTSVGASGAIMGVMGALFGLAYRAEGWNSQLTRFWALNSAIFIGAGIVLGMLGTEGSTDNACHVGGWLAGTAAGYLFAGKPPIVKRAESALLVGFSAVVVGCFAVAFATPVDVGMLPSHVDAKAAIHRIALDAEKAGDRDLARRAAMKALLEDPSDEDMKALLDRLEAASPTPVPAITDSSAAPR